MTEEWLDRWANGRTGWLEPAGNAGLKEYWPKMAAGSRVLVPFCGNSPDMFWLAGRAHRVVGIELSDVAARRFFDDHKLTYQVEKGKYFDCYVAKDLPITIFCGDYFEFGAEPFDALYDRGALVALPEALRRKYVAHTSTLVRPDAVRMIITLEYDQRVVDGPPYAVLPDEIGQYWIDLSRVAETDDIETCPPKFRAAGLKRIQEVVWLSGSAANAR